MRGLISVAVVILLASPAVLAESRENSWDNLAQLRPGQKIGVADMEWKARERVPG